MEWEIEYEYYIAILSQLWPQSLRSLLQKLQGDCQFSVAKPKPKKLLRPIITDLNNTMNQSELEANTHSKRQARETRAIKVIPSK